jgi:hypothetical protein
MDEQNHNDQNGQSLRTNGSVAERETEDFKKYLKILALFVVFFACFAVPFYCSYLAQEGAKKAMVKMDAAQLRNWAQIYRLKNGGYAGLEQDYEFSRVIISLRAMKGEAAVHIGPDSYCAVLSFKETSFCVDGTGYVGKDEGFCSDNFLKCE